MLREFNREDVVIATKAAHRKQGNDFVFDNSPEFLKKSVDESLKRLNTDYIDLFYIHFPDEHTPKDEAVNALNEMKKAGKIRSIGVSNFSLEQLKEANKDGLVDVLQGEYNLLNREAEKHSSRIRRSIIFHLSLTSRSYQVYWQESIQKIQRSQKATCETNRTLQGERFKENIRKVNKLAPIAEKHNVDIPHIVLAWYLARPEIDILIPGAKRADQLIDNIKTADVTLSQEDISFIDKLFA